VKLLFNAMNGIDRNETCWLKRARACDDGVIYCEGGIGGDSDIMDLLRPYIFIIMPITHLMIILYRCRWTDDDSKLWPLILLYKRIVGVFVVLLKLYILYTYIIINNKENDILYIPIHDDCSGYWFSDIANINAMTVTSCPLFPTCPYFYGRHIDCNAIQ